MSFRIRTAEERRVEIQSQATALGIDDSFISELVDTFYARIQAHKDLGPIFENHITEDWPHHLARMKDFWASVALSAGRYSGKPVLKHTKLTGVREEHFAMWLSLFEETLRDIAPNPKVVPYFLERAERIAQSLKFAMFGLPSLKVDTGIPTNQ